MIEAEEADVQPIPGGKWAVVRLTYLEQLQGKRNRPRIAVTDVAEVLFLAVIAFGVYLKAGLGWTCIAAGLEGLLFLTADTVLPFVLSRHGRRHGTDPSTRDRTE